MSNELDQWLAERQLRTCHHEGLGFWLESSCMGFSSAQWDQALEDSSDLKATMNALEAGAIANPDEERMVGHYWLRDPALAPNDDLRQAIEDTTDDVLAFAKQIHAGEIRAANGKAFSAMLSIGIGGSALGPQFISHALAPSPSAEGAAALRGFFIDNTDPDGIDRVLTTLGDELSETLVVTISKSGGTAETRNGLMLVEHQFVLRGIPFAQHAVAITGEGSRLDQRATSEGWIKRFPMWDWVGGRTSVMSAVGLLPAALEGVEVQELLDGAKEMDTWTRTETSHHNPAMVLAAAWFLATDGVGKKDMVILPYKDRLLLFSRYLQQLVMESLGKRLNLEGQVVHQGITVYGNKGSTDQHAYVQQLRDGVDNFFANFIEVLDDGDCSGSMDVEPGIRAGDYLSGFLQGTREALREARRPSLTMTIESLGAREVGALIALFERAVGFYAAKVGINAYHQPGVEAGKKAATRVLELQTQLMKLLRGSSGPQTLGRIAANLPEASIGTIYDILRHASVNREEIVWKRGSQTRLDTWEFVDANLGR